MKNILVVGAHYDDAELGVGGTCAKLASEGCNVYKLTLTDNVTNFKQKGIKVDNASSKKSSALACNILGVKEIDNFEPLPCNELKYSAALMQRIEKIIFELNIDTIFFHFDHDLNTDHLEASKICLIAGRHCKNLLMYQSNGYIPENQFHPTVFFNIDNYVDRKKEALNQYGSEHNRFNRMFDMNIKRNEVWGYGCENGYSEGFVPVKMVIENEI